MITLLLTAFEPFDGRQVNSSLEVARDVASGTHSGLVLTLLELPVVRERCEEMLFDSLDTAPPKILLMLGEAGDRLRVTPECIAINRENFRIPDNSGVQPGNQLIDPAGPAGYFTTLPVETMVDRMQQSRIPAEVSYTAGQYVCNRLFYRAMQYISLKQLHTGAGFIHLPFLHEQAILAGERSNGLSRQILVAAVETAIEVAMAEHAAR